MPAQLLKATLVGVLLACISCSCAGHKPFPDGRGPAGDAIPVAHPALAAVGDWYTEDDKRVIVNMRKGDSHPIICKGQTVFIEARVRRYTSTGSNWNNNSINLNVLYVKSNFRDCTAEEQGRSWTSSESSSYTTGDALPCCSDDTVLYGSGSEASVGSLTVTTDSNRLAHAKIKAAKVPLYDYSSSSGSGSNSDPVATAVLDLQVDCVALNEVDTTTSKDSCIKGECIVIKGDSSSVKCKSKYGDVKYSGTVKLMGAVQLQVNASSPPPGYVVGGQIVRLTDSQKVIL